MRTISTIAVSLTFTGCGISNVDDSRLVRNLVSHPQLNTTSNNVSTTVHPVSSSTQTPRTYSSSSTTKSPPTTLSTTVTTSRSYSSISTLSTTARPTTVSATARTTVTPATTLRTTARPTTIAPTTRPIDRAQVLRDLQSAADAIGAVVAPDNWEQVSSTIAVELSRDSVSVLPTDFSLAEANDFWTRSRGDNILSQAIVVRNCAITAYNECHALMMLVGNMPLPSDPVLIDQFLVQQYIKGFVNYNRVALATKLRGSSPNVGRDTYQYRFLSSKETGWFKGYAKNWAVRFPQVIETDPNELAPLIVDHSFYRLVMSNDPTAVTGSLRVRRNTAIASSSQELSLLSVASIRKGISSVRYADEESWGGGLLQEWFSLIDLAIDEEVFRDRDSAVGFNQLELSRVFSDDELRFVGRYLALCYIHNRPTGMYFPQAFFKHLLGHPLVVKDVQEIDADLYTSLNFFARPMTEEEFDEMDIDELPRSGATEPLTYSNMGTQLSQSILNIVTNDRPGEFALISEGFREILPSDVFDGIEMDQVRKFFCAEREIVPQEFIDQIDFHDTSDASWTEDRKTWIRNIINSFNQERLHKFLRFVTGFQNPPRGGFPEMGRIAFKAYRPEMLENRLPKSHTCFKSLDMPQYDTFEETDRILTNVVDHANHAGMDER